MDTVHDVGTAADTLNELIATMGNVGNRAAGSPVVLRLQPPEKLISAQDAIGSHIDSRFISTCSNRIAPGIAVCDYIVTFNTPADTFEIEPTVTPDGKPTVSAFDAAATPNCVPNPDVGAQPGFITC